MSKSCRRNGLRCAAAFMALVLVLGMGITAFADRRGTVKGSSVNIRAGASTSTTAVTQLSNGTEVQITGEEAGSDGHTWYSISFAGGSGYIRDDFVEVGEEIPSEDSADEPVMMDDAPSESMEQSAYQPEQPAQQSNAGNDYTVQYVEDENGELSWYLYNNIDGVRYKVHELVEAANQVDSGNVGTDKAARRYRIILVVLVVLLLVAIVSITLLVFRIRSVYEEVEEEHYRNQSKRNSINASRTQAPAARTGGMRTTAPQQSSGRTMQQSSAPARTTGGVRSEPRTVQAQPKPAREARYAEERPQQGVRKAPARTKNFAGDMDDDFEYNFVDLDDD